MNNIKIKKEDMERLQLDKNERIKWNAIEDMKNNICPICNSELTEYRFSEDIWGSYETIEIHNICKNCNLYENEYAYGNSCRKIYKKIFYDEKKHRFYIWFVKFLWKLKLIKKGDD